MFLVLAAAIAIWGVGVERAHSHATLIASTPADGEVLNKPPATISLHFNEPVSLLASALVHPTGKTVPLERSLAAGEVVTIELPPALEGGSYAVSWRVVSDDGHPIAATTFFAIGKTIGTAQTVQPDEHGGVAFSIWLVRLVLLGSLVFGVGGAAFRILAKELPRGAAIFVRIALGSGLLAAPLVVALQGLDLLGLGLPALFNVETWLSGLRSPFATTAIVSACSMASALLALEARGNRLSVLANVVALTLLGLCVCFSGHASVAEPRWLAATALFVHVITVTWWIGALVPLVLLLRLARREATPSLINFSRSIPYAVLPLLVSGTVLAVLQLGTPGPSWWSRYGLIFACKLALVVSLFGVASWNRWILTAPAAAGRPKALSQMRRGIALELVLAVIILALVSAWRFTPPPRALAHQPTTGMELLLQGPSLAAEVTIEDPRARTSDISVRLISSAPSSMDARSVKLLMKPPGTALAPVVREAGSAGSGTWVARQVPFPVPGTWAVEIEVRVSDFDLVKLQGTLEIERR